MPYPSLSVVRQHTRMVLARGMPWILGGQNDPSDKTSEVHTEYIQVSLFIQTVSYVGKCNSIKNWECAWAFLVLYTSIKFLPLSVDHNWTPDGTWLHRLLLGTWPWPPYRVGSSLRGTVEQRGEWAFPSLTQKRGLPEERGILDLRLERCRRVSYKVDFAVHHLSKPDIQFLFYMERIIFFLITKAKVWLDLQRRLHRRKSGWPSLCPGVQVWLRRRHPRGRRVGRWNCHQGHGQHVRGGDKGVVRSGDNVLNRSFFSHSHEVRRDEV